MKRLFILTSCILSATVLHAAPLVQCPCKAKGKVLQQPVRGSLGYNGRISACGCGGGGGGGNNEEIPPDKK